MNGEKGSSKTRAMIAAAEEQVAEKALSNLLRSLSVYLAVITAIVLLLSYGAITTYYAGYLRYFGISISDVNFFPSLADFVTRGSATISAILFAIVASLLGMVLANWMIKGFASIGLASEKKKGKLKWLKNLNNKPVLSRVEIKIFLILVFVVFSFKLVYFDSETMGFETAEKTSSFSSFIDESGDRKILIYQNANEGVFKSYDSDGGLSGSYTILPLTDKEYEKINIK